MLRSDCRLTKRIASALSEALIALLLLQMSAFLRLRPLAFALEASGTMSAYLVKLGFVLSPMRLLTAGPFGFCEEGAPEEFSSSHCLDSSGGSSQWVFVSLFFKLPIDVNELIVEVVADFAQAGRGLLLLLLLHLRVASLLLVLSSTNFSVALLCIALRADILHCFALALLIPSSSLPGLAAVCLRSALPLLLLLLCRLLLPLRTPLQLLLHCRLLLLMLTPLLLLAGSTIAVTVLLLLAGWPLRCIACKVCEGIISIVDTMHNLHNSILLKVKLKFVLEPL